jgi:glycosyltransferase involved in cell wall biosynthesis
VEFEERIRKPDLKTQYGSTVEYRGFVSGTEKANLWRDSDCFCFPSYYPAEAHPVSLLEAMAFGLPIIASRWRAIPDLFAPGYEGLVEIKSPRGIADAIHRFLTLDIGIIFRKQFLENYMEDRFLEKIKHAIQHRENGA